MAPARFFSLTSSFSPSPQPILINFLNTQVSLYHSVSEESVSPAWKDSPKLTSQVSGLALNVTFFLDHKSILGLLPIHCLHHIIYILSFAALILIYN